MREIIEFLGKEIRKGGIKDQQTFKDHQTFERQAIEAVVKTLGPWLHRVTMKNIGSIRFAGEHDFGIHGLEAARHCQKRSFPKGITSKTQAFIGEYRRGLVEDADVPKNVFRYQQLHWAFTRKGRWLRMVILYDIKHTLDGEGKSVENISLYVEETSLEVLVRDGWGYQILNGLSDEVQRVIEHRVKDLQELISLRAHIEFINSLIVAKAVKY